LVNEVSIHTTSRVSRVASFIGFGLEIGLGLASSPAVCIYVECLHTRLQALLAVCIASVFG